MFRSIVSKIPKKSKALATRSFAKCTKPPIHVTARENSITYNWFSDVSAYPIIAIMSAGGLIVLYEWYHAFDCPDVKISKYNRTHMDCIENDRNEEDGKKWASHRGDPHFR